MMGDAYGLKVEIVDAAELVRLRHADAILRRMVANGSIVLGEWHPNTISVALDVGELEYLTGLKGENDGC